jgi:cystathionine beta-lyase/cystathionine gamma-synthase
MSTSKTRAIATKLVHAGEPEPRVDGAVRMPIFQTAMYEYSGDDPRGARYIRYNNTPNQDALAAKLAALENAEAALVTGSGMAAISATLLTTLEAGDHLLALDTLYGGTHHFVNSMLPRLGMSHTAIDGNAPETWGQQVRDTTKAVYVETITNPLMRVPDHRALVEFCRARGLVSIIDNTFASPVNFRPGEIGYDVSVHSCTKYINGHSDVVAGAVIADGAFVGRLRETMASLGGTLDPHAAFLVHRGVTTLGVRMRGHNENALKVAQFLAGHPRIARVSYPGLENHPDHARAAELLDGFGGMLAFEVEGGLEGAERFIDALTIPIIAPSLGGPETLITRPAITSHVDLGEAERNRLGITDGLIRCSIGLEDADELIEDFGHALG